MTHTDRRPPSEAEHPDEYTIGPAVEEIWYDEGDESWKGSDGRGEFDLDAGSKTKPDPNDYKYEPCGFVLRSTYDRYNEQRFCEGMARSNFGLDQEACKHHVSRTTDGWVQNKADRFTSGAHAKSKANVFRYMQPHEQIVTNDLYQSLVEESVYDFATEIEHLTIDVEGEDFGGSADELLMDHPIPTNHETRCKALWYAALDFISMQSIRKEQFREVLEDENVDAIGERWQVVASGEQGAVYDKDEHHLNLPLSRLQKDYKQHLKFGGVTVDPTADMEQNEMSERDWVLEVHPGDDADDPAPETETNFGTPPIEERVETPTIEDVDDDMSQVDNVSEDDE